MISVTGGQAARRTLRVLRSVPCAALVHFTGGEAPRRDRLAAAVCAARAVIAVAAACTHPQRRAERPRRRMTARRRAKSPARPAASAWPAMLVAGAAHGGHWFQRKQAAASDGCRSRTLAVLCGDADAWVREVAAANPVCPGAALRRLCTDDCWAVRAAAAQRPIIARVLRRDGDHRVRAVAASATGAASVAAAGRRRGAS